MQGLSLFVLLYLVIIATTIGKEAKHKFRRCIDDCAQEKCGTRKCTYCTSTKDVHTHSKNTQFYEKPEGICYNKPSTAMVTCKSDDDCQLYQMCMSQYKKTADGVVDWDSGNSFCVYTHSQSIEEGQAEQDQEDSGEEIEYPDPSLHSNLDTHLSVPIDQNSLNPNHKARIESNSASEPSEKEKEDSTDEVDYPDPSIHPNLDSPLSPIVQNVATHKSNPHSTPSNGKYPGTNEEQAPFLDFHKFVPLPSKQWTSTISEGAQIELNQVKDGYYVSIVFNKICDKKKRNQLFNDNITWIFDEEEMGPDEVLIHFEGASIQIQVAKSLDFCSKYYSLFQVPSYGIYRLKIVRLRQNYDALRDGDFYPEIKYEEFLDVKIDDALSYYAPKPCSSVVTGYWVAHEPFGTHGYYLEHSVQVADKCKANGMFRSLPIFSNVNLHSAFSELGCAKDVQNYYWNRKICSPTYNHQRDGYGEVVEYNHPNLTKIMKPPIGYSANPMNDWFKSKKILFVGDSDMRSLADHFLTHVCKAWYPEEWLRNQNESIVDLDSESSIPTYREAMYVEVNFQKEVLYSFKKTIDDCRRQNPDIGKCNAYYTANSEEEKTTIKSCFDDPTSESCDVFERACAGSQFAFLQAMYCQRGIAAYMSKGFDYIVFNCGNHLAKDPLMTYDHYRLLLKDVGTRMKSLQMLKPDTQFFYLENVALPLHQDDKSFETHDKRTYHRLMLYDILAKWELEKNAGLRMYTIPAFYSTLALYDKFCDCGHYPWGSKVPQLLNLVETIKKASNARKFFKLESAVDVLTARR